VLLAAVVELLRPSDARWMVDCTAGLGGHAEALLAEAPAGACLIAIDRDAGNLRRLKERLARPQEGATERLRCFQCNFARIRQVLSQAGADRVDVLLADLGVSSSQLDDPGRGFSFLLDGPLDMRFDADGAGLTAAELVNRLGERELADLLYRNSDERHSRRIARAIVSARRQQPIERTGRLAEIVARAVGGRRGGRIHPATRTFQALRIAVNEELESLDQLLAALPDVLAPGGRAAVISFHSQEDRRVKRAFSAMKSAGSARIITPKPRVADDEEIEVNPRSRSAKLRCLQRV
jgi:16S rRNA (cytosine1402-N4)-methyltransferase